MRRALLVAVLGVACSRPRAVEAPPEAGASNRGALVAERPYALLGTKKRDPQIALPLVLLLHGYGSSGRAHESAWGFAALGEREGFLVVAPDGTTDAEGNRFWNATDACCNMHGSSVDDVAYLAAVLDDVAAKAPVDPKRIYVVGHSNGGFMAHRLACDLSDRVAAIVSLAGAMFKDPARCRPTSPVAIVQVHGTADAVVNPAGGRVFDRPLPPYPSLQDTMASWAQKLGCAPVMDRDVATLDLDARIAGAETHVDRFRGCRADVELWTIEGGGHIPAMRSTWAESVWRFFEAQRKP